MAKDKSEEHRERASSFYKQVLNWQKERHGAHGRHSRLAAIGLPDAIQADQPEAHVRRFIHCALKDGVPMDVVKKLARRV
ncbi:MAG: hypothetical protein P4N41_16680 [Negativicutes bacterium]|nr:hypothetical protein [Negativicutes bacterium]MDR3591291.1 hypothetical protein [Negativicutes bacterium]